MELFVKQRSKQDLWLGNVLNRKLLYTSINIYTSIKKKNFWKNFCAHRMRGRQHRVAIDTPCTCGEAPGPQKPPRNPSKTKSENQCYYLMQPVIVRKFHEPKLGAWKWVRFRYASRTVNEHFMSKENRVWIRSRDKPGTGKNEKYQHCEHQEKFRLDINSKQKCRRKISIKGNTV